MGAIITITNANLFLQQKRLADLAIKTKLPSMYQGSTWVEAGGLMSYSTDELGAFRRANAALLRCSGVAHSAPPYAMIVVLRRTVIISSMPYA